MSNNKTIVVGDLHMCDRIRTDTLFNKEYDNKLKTLLENFISRDDCKELVLQGDIFDTWAYPANEKPPKTIDKIVNFWSEEGRQAIQMLKKCADSGKQVYFINGNHDQTVKKDDIDRVFNKKINFITPDDYTKSHPGIRIEHGHGEDLMNNSFNQESCEIQGFPVGYFLSRIFYSFKNPAASREAFYKGLNDAIIWVESMPDVPVQATKERRNEQKGENIRFAALKLILEHQLQKLQYESVGDEVFDIKMPDGPDVEFSQVIKLFFQVIEYGLQKYKGNLTKILRSLMASEDRNENLKWYASQLLENPGNHLIVLGHTHERKDTEKNLNYANPACFCADTRNKYNGNPFYVEIDGDSAAVRGWNE